MAFTLEIILTRYLHFVITVDGFVTRKQASSFFAHETKTTSWNLSNRVKYLQYRHNYKLIINIKLFLYCNARFDHSVAVSQRNCIQLNHKTVPLIVTIVSAE